MENFQKDSIFSIVVFLVIQQFDDQHFVLLVIHSDYFEVVQFMTLYSYQLHLISMGEEV